jgi:hypothetical protein
VGGHAWVEIKENGVWMVLDPTSGPYYEDETDELVDREGFEYDYWMYHEYPIIEVWAYYNDVYFTDSSEEVAIGWSSGADTVVEDTILFGFGFEGSISILADVLMNFIGLLRQFIGI